jgi:hypothetical protein
MKKILMLLILLGLTGCSTPLQKADRFWAAQNYREAQKFYAQELAAQQVRAQLPAWNGKTCNYQFNKDNTGRALWGMAQTFKEMGARESALYYYFYYTQYCVRQGLSHESHTDTWKDYLAEPVPRPLSPAGLSAVTNTAPLTLTNAAPITETSDAIKK